MGDLRLSGCDELRCGGNRGSVEGDIRGSDAASGMDKCFAHEASVAPQFVLYSHIFCKNQTTNGISTYAGHALAIALILGVGNFSRKGILRRRESEYLV